MPPLEFISSIFPEASRLRGSPRISWYRALCGDRSGATWSLLLVRQRPDLSKKEIQKLAADSLTYAQHKKRVAKKPSLQTMSAQVLTKLPPNATRTIYSAAQRRMEALDKYGHPISFSTAKHHVRAWRASQKS